MEILVHRCLSKNNRELSKRGCLKSQSIADSRTTFLFAQLTSNVINKINSA